MTAVIKINDKLRKSLMTPENIARGSYNNRVRRTVLVTRGTDGIGPEICKKMANLGHFVAATYQNEAKARAWQNRMEREGYLFYIYKCDTADFCESQSLIKHVTEDLGPIHILVNNADGTLCDSSQSNMTLEWQLGIISNDFGGIFNVTCAAISSMSAVGFGRVVNIFPINGQKRQCSQANYSRAKAAMLGFTKSLAREVAKNGVTVNTISPGYVTTDMILSMPQNPRGSIVIRVPVGRLGKPGEVAHAVSCLASEESGFISGVNIAANGSYFVE